MLRFKLNEKKATQVASLLIKLNGNSLNYMKLMKLMYLIDREALLKWDRPVVGDEYFSLRYGPVLSNVLDIINSGDNPNRSAYWYEYINIPENYEISLKKDSCDDELSEREIKLVSSISNKYKNIDRFKLCELCHDMLPEWEDPRGSSLAIMPRDILKALDKTDKEIEIIEEEIGSLQAFDNTIHARN